MDYIKSIKWYHVLIICVIGIALFLIFTNTGNSSNSANIPENAPQQPQAGQPLPQNENFNGQNNNSKQNPKITLYYSTGCGYCRQMLPEWEKFENNAKDNLKNVNVVSIRCEGGNENVCTQEGIEGYPTIVFQKINGEKVKFEGDRTASEFMDFCRKHQ